MKTASAGLGSVLTAEGCSPALCSTDSTSGSLMTSLVNSHSCSSRPLPATHTHTPTHPHTTHTHNTTTATTTAPPHTHTHTHTHTYICMQPPPPTIILPHTPPPLPDIFACYSSRTHRHHRE